MRVSKSTSEKRSFNLKPDTLYQFLYLSATICNFSGSKALIILLFCRERRGSLVRKQFALHITPKVVTVGSGRQTLPLQLTIR